MAHKKKRSAQILLFLLLAALCLTSTVCCGREELEEPLTLLVANDLHYLSPSLLGDGSYFREPVARADGKTVHYSGEITDAFLWEVMEKKPQALILAGDLTLSGAKASHEELAARLQEVKEAGVDILVIPGNHDLDTTAVDYSGETLREAPGTSSAEFVALYEPLLPAERLVSRDQDSFSYFYEVSEKLWVLMLDTNTYGKGFVKDSTLEWLDGQLAVAARERIDVVSVTHQNLYAHSDMLSFGYQLYNADALLAVFEKHGNVQCNLSAHVHIQSIYEGEGPVELVTSALCVSGLHYGELTYNGKGIDYAARTAAASEYAEEMGLEDPTLLSLEGYAAEYFEKIARSHAEERLQDSGLTAAEVALMVEAYAKINTAYFEGRPINADDYREGVALWREKGTPFVANYIDSMLRSNGEKREYRVKFK